MMRISLLKTAVIAATIAVLTLPTTTASADPPGWKLVWQDEFDSLDTDLWQVVSDDKPTNNSLHVYLPEQVTTENGRLVITAEENPDGALKYRSGQVISKSEQKHGRWEIRAKLPTTPGMWPAIWLLPNVQKYPWPSGGEIDIMENRGNEPTITSSAFHYGVNDPYKHDFVFHQQQTRDRGEFVDYSADFHDYAMEWTEKQLRFYVDGVSYYTVYDEDIDNFLSQNAKPMQLVINNAIGGDFLPNPNRSTELPQRMEIDWVRVYEAADSSSKRSLDNSGFEDGGLSGWTVFGNDLMSDPNVSAAQEAASEGDSSLKIFGAFQWGARYCGVSQAVTVSPGERISASLKSFVRSEDTLAGRENRVLLKIEFYSEPNGRFASETMLGVEEVEIVDKDVEEDTWQEHSIEAIAPEDAVEARLAIVFHQPGYDPGAVHIDDVNLVITPAGASETNASLMKSFDKLARDGDQPAPQP